MKFIFVLIVVLGFGKFGISEFLEYKLKSDIERANEKLPMTYGNMRLDEVIYENKVVRLNTSILDTSLYVSSEAKMQARSNMLRYYCSSFYFEKKLSVDFNAEQLVMRGLGDRAHIEEFLISIKPSDC